MSVFLPVFSDNCCFPGPPEKPPHMPTVLITSPPAPDSFASPLSGAVWPWSSPGTAPARGIMVVTRHKRPLLLWDHPHPQPVCDLPERQLPPLQLFR